MEFDLPDVAEAQNVAEARYGHLSHRNIYLTVRTNARTFAITSSCIRLKHIAINAIPEIYRCDINIGWNE